MPEKKMVTKLVKWKNIVFYHGFCKSHAKTSVSKTVRNIRIYSVFLFLPRTKLRYFTMFSHPEAPKSSQNIGIYDVLQQPKKQA